MTLVIKAALLAVALGVLPSPKQSETATPIEFQRVVALFKEMTEVQPLRLHEQCAVFALGERYRRNEHVESVITVTEDAPRLTVSFLVNAEFGMNFVREFFEAPFFTREESQEFYALLYGPNEHAAAVSERFGLEFTRVKTPAWHFISMTFGPPPSRTPLP